VAQHKNAATATSILTSFFIARSLTLNCITHSTPVPVAARSKAQICDYSPAEIVDSNPTGEWMFICCECCVLSGRGLSDELITRPEESYRLCSVVVCDLETSGMRRSCPTVGCRAKTNTHYTYSGSELYTVHW